ncbi:prolipoprotein diacylglyceryl transferase family protein [Thiovibrio sp. JS02]
MNNAVFVLSVASVSVPLLFLAFRHLPRENWQFLAAIPAGREEGGGWRGKNLTFYGVLLAGGSVLGVMVFFFLLASVGLPISVITGLAGCTMFVSLVAAKVVARLVEGKKNTFTVAGGATAGFYLLPLLIWGHGLFPFAARQSIPALAAMAALATAYIIGEGVGRLACLSFGCCYGKPLHQLSPFWRKVFARAHCTFQGETKKIAYASDLAGVKVLPVQAITSLLYVLAGLMGVFLFLEGRFAASFAFTAIFSMAWRVVSERFRADYRGDGRWSAYQKMGLVNIAYAFTLFFLLPAPVLPAAMLGQGFAALWRPEVILFLQLLWLALFLYTGVSRVTGARLHLYVRNEQI